MVESSPTERIVEYPLGTILPDYIPGLDIAELVQTGGQKAVYRATIRGQVVALKLIALDSKEVTDEEAGTDISVAVERAQREVAILEQVDLPVLARRGPLGLFTVPIDDGRWLGFTEEWIEGRGLPDMIREGRLSPAQVARMGVDLVQAVCWLSGQDVVHRDIKPANIIWAADRSRFVLLDPGVAFDLRGPSLTLLPMPVGTVPYFSPEQMDPSRKRTMDFRSDLFAIGVVLYEAAAGEHPFMTVRTTLSEVMAGILTATPKALADRIEDFPPTLSDFVARLLGKEPHLRYRMCDHAREAIEEIAASFGVNA